MLIGFGINTHNKTSFKRVADDKDFKHPQHKSIFPRIKEEVGGL